MNYDVDNAHEFSTLISDIKRRYEDRSKLELTVHPINGEYNNRDGRVAHGSEEWFTCKQAEFYEMIRNSDLPNSNTVLPYLRFMDCQAGSDSSLTITAHGEFVQCPEQFGDEEISGNVWEGLIHKSVKDAWKKQKDYPRCIMCEFHPRCYMIEKCAVKDTCWNKQK